MATDRFETACRIAGVVGSGDVFETKVQATPRQGVVDLWWAALSAGRMLGVPVDVRTSEPITHGEDRAMVVVEVQARVSDPLSA